MRKYFFIVLTGGPCGGKTSGIVGISKALQELGYLVIVIPEAATQVMESGITAKRFGVELFQDTLVDIGVQTELCMRRFAAALPANGPPVVFLLDRATHDCQPYMTPSAWSFASAKHRVAELVPLHGYSGVIHITSAAVGAPEFYQTENNPHRTETAEQAAEKDQQLVATYHGVERWFQVQNTDTFAVKMEQVVNAACSIIGEPEPRWHQRKFTVKSVDLAALAILNPVEIEIAQFHLGSFTYRRRRLLSDGSESYDQIWKQALLETTGASIKIARPLSEKLFYREWDRARAADAPMSRRRRLSFAHDGRRMVYDRYDKPAGRELFEVHLGDAGDEFSPPPGIELLKEVTGDPRHTAEYYAHPAPP